jgi:Beta-propeller repeat
MYAPTPSVHTTTAARRVLLLGALLGLAGLVALSGRTAPPAPDGLRGADRTPSGGILPSVVVPAASGGARFEARAAGGTLVFAPGGVTLARPAGDLASSSLATVSLRWLGAGDVRPAASHRLPGVMNDLRGRDPRRWRTHVPTYEAVLYRGLYRGVDARLAPAAAGAGLGAMATYRLAPGADPGVIRWRYAGATSVSRVGGTGALRISFGPGPALVEPAPVAWQMIGGIRVPLTARYRLLAGSTVGLAVAGAARGAPVLLAAAPSRRVAVAPRVAFSTFLGAKRWDEAYDVETDAAGNTYVAGLTESPDLPTAHARQGFGGVMDAFVAKLSPDGRTLLYSTFLGGSGMDAAFSLAVDRGGNAYVTGRTGSEDFPTTRALQGQLSGRGCQLREQATPCHDAFVTKLGPSGQPVYSTYFGGTRNEEGVGIAVDRAGAAYLTGNTDSLDLPLRNPIQGAFHDSDCPNDLPCPEDTFVTKLSPAGTSVVYSTYLGGKALDLAGGIAVDKAGSAYVTGTTRSPDFPTRNPLQGTLRDKLCGPPPGFPCTDAYVAKLTPAGAGLVYATFLGGSKNERAGGITVDDHGQAAITGSTDSPDFPTRRAAQPKLDNSSCSPEAPPKEICDDGFVTKLNSSGRALVFSTYIAGNGEDQGLGVTVDKAGDVYVAGSTDSRNFRTVNPVQPKLAGRIDAFVQKYRATSGTLLLSTFFGGTKNERANGVAVDPSRRVHLAGRTESPDFPTQQPLQGALAGDIDAFASVLLQ